MINGDTSEDVNTIIEQIFADFEVDGVEIPVKWQYYDGHEDAYVVYSTTDKSDVLRAEDGVQAFVQYVDFGVYSKGNYTKIAKAIKSKLIENNFMWNPEGDLDDMYNEDTKYYIKVMNFAIERST